MSLVVDHEAGPQNEPTTVFCDGGPSIEMLDILAWIETSRDLLQSTKNLMNMNPLERDYASLKTQIETLDEDSEALGQIKRMVATTHAETHNEYTLSVKKVYSVAREEEAKKFEPFNKFHNRRMLWHGSRLSNMAGILSKGLRIAPSEAPSTGCMFGKGLYFADCVSKSANYCKASRTNPRGLLLLCEVACGDVYPCQSAEFMERAPHGYHSTAGIGKNSLDMANEMRFECGATACAGPIIANTEAQESNLLYNEFVIYDTSQVRLAYMVEVEFNFAEEGDAKTIDTPVAN